MMTHLLLPMSLISLISIGAIFGFFYAWVCATMWGLDTADPRIAISTMQTMQASVWNAVFFPIFFLATVFLALTALVGAFLTTALVNVPKSTALADVTVPTTHKAARQIWVGYSPASQFWNTLRDVFSGVALLLTGLALVPLKTEKT